MKRTKVTFFLILISFSAFANYELDKNLENAYRLIFSLDFKEAESLIKSELKEKPNNDLSLLYLNSIDFLRAFITEEKSDYLLLKKNSQEREEKLRNKKENAYSPYHLYVLSELQIQQALVAIKFEENFFSAKEIKKAYSLIEKNEVAYPTFLLNKKVKGLLNVIIGAVPTKFQWLVKIAGMEGSISQGIHDLQDAYLLGENSPFKCYQPEILFYLGTVHFAFSIEDDTAELLGELSKFSKENQLMAYVHSNILMRQGKNDAAIDVINSSLNKNAEMPVYLLYYKRGQARLRKLDYTASQDFEFYLNHYRGKNNIKSAYQKLSWISLLNGDTAGYRKQLSNCKITGVSILDEDKDASYEAASNEIINIYLLKSRLLFDGGYYNKALTEIVNRKITDFVHFHDQLEVTYRLGRIMQMMGRSDKAIQYYKMTLANGTTSNYHFAANSSLLLGLIFENKKEYIVARDYFNKCLSLSYERYKNSIDQKAKAGLERIRVKLK